jgi:lipopolysaccharide/colanic/teichoic acid biosynthesis glycosyltransferase
MKRLFDFSLALVFSILFIPLWIVIAIAIKLNSPGPVFFRQLRVGRHGKHFKIFKYRSMIVDAEKKGLQITVGGRDPRITKIGYLLRKTKLDELPQLFNIVLGDMSFVGPRPEVPKYVKMYSSEQRHVLSVRPGITDVASIKYIDENELLKDAENPEKMYIEKIMPDKLNLNLKYLNNRTLLSDIGIIIKTIAKML